MVFPLPAQQAGAFLRAALRALFPDALERVHRIVVVEANAGRKQRRDVFDQAARELFPACAVRTRRA